MVIENKIMAKTRC